MYIGLHVIILPPCRTGRKAQTGTLNLQELGVELVEETGKIVGGYGAEHERTAVPNIFAVGDVLEVSCPHCVPSCPYSVLCVRFVMLELSPSCVVCEICYA